MACRSPARRRPNGILLPQQQVGLDSNDIAQPQSRDPITELAVAAIPGISDHGAGRNTRRDGGAYLIERDLRLGLEDDIRRNPGLRPPCHVVHPWLWRIEPMCDRQAAMVVGDGQRHHGPTVVLLARLAAILPRDPDRMAAFLGEAGVAMLICPIFTSTNARRWGAD
jgi:hypothetical protein